MLTHELGHPGEIISDNIQDIGSSRAWSDGEARYECEVKRNEMCVAKCASKEESSLVHACTVGNSGAKDAKGNAMMRLADPIVAHDTTGWFRVSRAYITHI